MKNYFKVLGIVVLTAAIVFSMMACEEDKGNGDDGITIDGWEWSTYTDVQSGGTSTITMTRGAGNDNNKLSFSGSVAYIKNKNWGEACIVAKPDSTNLAALKSKDGISFKCKGDGKQYWVELRSTDVTDWDNYQFVFKASETEQTITVPYTSLNQQGWGETVDFNKNSIYEIVFIARPDVTGVGNFNLSIWDLKVVDVE